MKKSSSRKYQNFIVWFQGGISAPNLNLINSNASLMWSEIPSEAPYTNQNWAIEQGQFYESYTC